MASSIASLFGPTAEEIVYARQQEDKALRQQQLQQGLAMQSSPLAQQYYQAGYNIVSGLGGMFGPAPMQDPRLGQSIKIRQILGSTDVSDLNDPDKVETLSQQMSKAGLGKEALYFADRAKDLRAYQLELNKLGTIVPVKDFVLEDGTQVGKDGYGRWFTLDGRPVDVSQLKNIQTYKDITTAGTKEATLTKQMEIEQQYLKDTDLSIPDQRSAANLIYQEAQIKAKKEQIPLETAIEKTAKEFFDKGVIYKSDKNWWDRLTDKDAKLSEFTQDWYYNPDALTEVPLKPRASKNDANEWSIVGVTKE